MFEFSAPLPVTKSLIPACRRRLITSTTAGEFAAAFMNTSLFTQDGLVSSLCPEDSISSFYFICSQILDFIAPLKLRSIKAKPVPWLTNTTRTLRQCCRQAERRWKKYRLQVSLGKESLSIRKLLKK